MASNEKVLVIAPWGNPFAWSCVAYRYCETSSRCLPNPVQSRSSLGAITELYSGVQGADTRVLIIVLDTLATAPPPRDCSIRGPCECNGRYEDIVECVKRRVEEWIEQCSGCSGGKASLSKLLEKGYVTVEVLPGYGTFGGCRFDSSIGNLLQSFRAEVFHIALRELINFEPDRIVLDLTHGINYMPSLSLKAVELAAVMYSVATKRSVSLHVVNSEPVPQPRPQSALTLDIHTVADYTLDYRRAIRDAAEKALGYTKLSGIARGEKEVMRELGPTLSDEEKRLGLNREAKLVAKTILYSLPLPLIYTSCEIRENAQRENIEAFTKTLSRIIDRVRRIRTTQWTTVNESRVEHKLVFSPEEVEKAYAAAALLDYALRAAVIDCSHLEENGVEISVLEKVAEDLRSIAELAKTIIDQEVSSLRCTAKLLEAQLHLCPRTTLEYLQVLGLDKWPGLECKTPNPRNLYAHIGFERNTIELMLDTRTRQLRVRYRENCWSIVKEEL